MKRRGFLKGLFGAAAAAATAKVAAAAAAIAPRKWKVEYNIHFGAVVMDRDTVVQIDVVED